METQNGFTLVELAIVLMIIGLLIGGILRGQELMENARITATIQQVKSYEGAMITFRDTYANIPGDMIQATNRIPGCTTANLCKNGNGDGVIGVATSATTQVWMDIDPSIDSENTQFWKHLAMAHLISGVDPSASTPEWGRSHPVAKNNAGFFARFANTSAIGGNAGGTSDTYFVLRRNISGLWSCGGGVTPNSLCAISPMRASQLDRKMDDGVAYSGDVISVSANWSTGCGLPSMGVNGINGYAEALSENACDVMFRER